LPNLRSLLTLRHSRFSNFCGRNSQGRIQRSLQALRLRVGFVFFAQPPACVAFAGLQDLREALGFADGVAAL
jgi:hypothetical protein